MTDRGWTGATGQDRDGEGRTETGQTEQDRDWRPNMIETGLTEQDRHGRTGQRVADGTELKRASGQIRN